MPGGEDGFKPITPDQVTDEKLVAGQLRALQREVRDGFESIAQSLKAFERVDAKLDVIIDRQNVMESRLDVIDKWRAATDVRLAALERPIVAELETAPLPRAATVQRRRKPAKKRK